MASSRCSGKAPRSRRRFPRRHAAAGRNESNPAAAEGFLAVLSWHKHLASMLVTHHLLRETPPSPGLTLRLQSLCEPRRRDRLPEMG